MFLGPRPLDIGFVVDSSNNVGSANWNRLLSFAKDAVKSFRPSWYGNRIGFISYGDNANVDFNFNTLQDDQLNPARIRGIIDSVRYQPRGGRRINLALNVAYRDLFSERGGYRPNARQVLNFFH